MNNTPKNVVYTDVAVATTYHIDISGGIRDIENYLERIQVIRQATERDKIILHINSPGGELLITAQLLNAINSCPAEVHASLEGECCSAATFLLLCADSWTIYPNTMFMAHNYSAGYYGTGDDPMHQAKAVKEFAKGFIESYYTNFLTKEEINNITNHNDTVWLTGDQVAERLEGYQAAREEFAATEAANKAVGDFIKTVQNVVPQVKDNEVFVDILKSAGFEKIEEKTT